MKFVYYFILIGLGAIGCSEEEAFRTPNLGGEVITGFQYRDRVGNLVQKVGQPNTKTSSEDGAYNFFAFPIPSRDVIFLSVFNNESRQIERVWITAAIIDNALYQSIVINSALLVVAQGTPLIEIEPSDNQSISINVSSLPPGGYRLYVQIDDVLLWDNILIQRY